MEGKMEMEMRRCGDFRRKRKEVGLMVLLLFLGFPRDMRRRTNCVLCCRCVVSE